MTEEKRITFPEFMQLADTLSNLSKSRFERALRNAKVEGWPFLIREFKLNDQADHLSDGLQKVFCGEGISQEGLRIVAQQATREATATSLDDRLTLAFVAIPTIPEKLPRAKKSG